MTHGRDDIRDLYAQWFSAMERGDIDSCMALVTGDVVLKGPAAPAVHGRDALRQALEAFHREFTETISYSIDELEVAGDWAYVRIAEEATLTSRTGGEAVSISGMHLGILRRVDDGVWRVACDVSSLDHPPAGK